MPLRGRVPCVENYSPEDVERLLEIIGTVLPTGANEWEVVLHNYEDYANEFDRAERELTSLKKKLSGLLNVKKPSRTERVEHQAERCSSGKRATILPGFTRSVDVISW
ncbi:hypothetical protein F443_11588 [Phytophthora nicotianae P1569]|uniref:DUF6818 domain-containing protein n=1 Tax=Phytophthora nicotianae P1569 TaxID=1317065 RepID=V9EW01_PHYNI|nr:hypothetical protein F443_11588 [Phytophthora nicotianae P1569]